MNDIDRLVSYSACPNKLGQLEVERWEVEDEETAVATVGAASRNGKVSTCAELLAVPLTGPLFI